VENVSTPSEIEAAFATLSGKLASRACWISIILIGVDLIANGFEES